MHAVRNGQVSIFASISGELGYKMLMGFEAELSCVKKLSVVY